MAARAQAAAAGISGKSEPAAADPCRVFLAPVPEKADGPDWDLVDPWSVQARSLPGAPSIFGQIFNKIKAGGD